MPDFFSVVSTRTSIRKFDATREVPDELIEKLLRAAMCAPTACNTRPWHFVVVRDAAKLAALAAGLPYSRINGGARCAVVVCGDTDNGLGTPAERELWVDDCSAATQNLLLAAHACGLGAVWTAVHPVADRVAAVSEILSIPARFTPLCLVPIGYPAESPEPKDKWNPTRIHRDEW